jgi:hypothetical protein
MTTQLMTQAVSTSIDLMSHRPVGYDLAACNLSNLTPTTDRVTRRGVDLSDGGRLEEKFAHLI